MCLLTYLPPGSPPDETALANGAEQNPHGHGYAVITAQGIVVGKSFDFEESLDNFIRIRHQHPGGPALFHSRFRTHGKTSQANIHPFEVSGQPSTVLAHNGILPLSVQPRRRQRKSDTRILAEDCLGKAISDRFDDDSTRVAFEHWLGPWNKVLVLTVDPRYAKQSYLFNEKAGIWNDGAWYSNADFRSLVPAVSGWYDGTCAGCDRFATASLDGICVACDSCVECASRPGDCPRWCPRFWTVDLCEECDLPTGECECASATSGVFQSGETVPLPCRPPR